MAILKTAAIAAHLRRAFKAAFPDTAFAVATGNAGSKITITWTGAPTRDAVGEIAYPFKCPKDDWDALAPKTVTITDAAGRESTGKSYVEYMFLIHNA